MKALFPVKLAALMQALLLSDEFAKRKPPKQFDYKHHNDTLDRIMLTSPNVHYALSVLDGKRSRRIRLAFTHSDYLMDVVNNTFIETFDDETGKPLNRYQVTEITGWLGAALETELQQMLLADRGLYINPL